MAAITAADTRVRPAAAALEAGIAVDRPYVFDELSLDRDQLQAAIASLVVRMNREEVTEGELDELTGDVAGMLALAEDLRRVRAKAAARFEGDSRRWRDRLDLA